MASDCCDDACETGRVTTGCPTCGHKGRSVDRITLKALLVSGALKRLAAGEYRFCAERSCSTVYYGPDGSVFGQNDLTVPVWQKTDDPNVFVCYCFAHSEASITAEIARTGETRVEDEIRQLVQDGRCACEVRNPQGSCCLGNVARVVKASRAKESSVSTEGGSVENRRTG